MDFQNIQSMISLFQFVLLLSVEREGFFLEKYFHGKELREFLVADELKGFGNPDGEAI